MGLVDQQHGIEAPGQFRQVRQRSDIAIHAEQRVGHNQFSAHFGGPGEHRFQHLAIAMGIDENFRPRQAAAIDQAGVVLAVAEDRVAPADEAQIVPTLAA